MENWNQVMLASRARGTGNELRRVSLNMKQTHLDTTKVLLPPCSSSNQHLPVQWFKLKNGNQVWWLFLSLAVFHWTELFILYLNCLHAAICMTKMLQEHYFRDCYRDRIFFLKKQYSFERSDCWYKIYKFMSNWTPLSNMLWIQV